MPRRRSANAIAKSERRRDPIPEHFANIEAAAEFWDTHDLADYVDLTQPVDFSVDLQRRHYLFALAPELAERIAVEADKQGLSAETLLNLWLSERFKAANA
jgi:hypothetical protein